LPFGVTPENDFVKKMPVRFRTRAGRYAENPKLTPPTQTVFVVPQYQKTSYNYRLKARVASVLGHWADMGAGKQIPICCGLTVSGFRFFARMDL
jgi:hypothetical protein